MVRGAIFYHLASPFDNICQKKGVKLPRVNANFPSFALTYDNFNFINTVPWLFRKSGFVGQV